MSLRDTQGNHRTTNVRQRKKQQHLLDVKIRASTERARRLRAIINRTFKIVLFVSIVSGGWIGGKEALRRFVWENPDYMIKEVRIVSDGSLTRDQVLKASGITTGANIFLVNLSNAREAIEKLPQVEDAEVTRTMPGCVTVNITERRPIAWVAVKADEDPTASESALLIDARGRLMRSKVKLEEYLHFPIITGLVADNLYPGDRVTSSEMRAALELVQLTSDSTRFQARCLDISKGYCVIVTDGSRAKITFGLDRIPEQLDRLKRYFNRAAEDHRELQTVNLLVERNTPVTFADSDFTEPAATAALSAVKTTEARPHVEAPSTTAKLAAATPIPRAIPVTAPVSVAAPAPVKSSRLTPASTNSAASRQPVSIKRQPFRMR